MIDPTMGAAVIVMSVECDGFLCSTREFWTVLVLTVSRPPF